MAINLEFKPMPKWVPSGWDYRWERCTGCGAERLRDNGILGQRPTAIVADAPHKEGCPNDHEVLI